MELFYFLTSVCLIIGNLVMKVSPDSKVEHKVAYILCLYLIIFPIVSQLWHRRIRKTPVVWLAILLAIASFVCLSASFFFPWVLQLPEFSLIWATFFFALFVQSIIILVSCLHTRTSATNRFRYDMGLWLLGIGLLIKLGVIVGLIVLVYLMKIGLDVSILSSVGIGGYAIGLIGVRVMSMNVYYPVDKEAMYR